MKKRIGAVSAVAAMAAIVGCGTNQTENTTQPSSAARSYVASPTPSPSRNEIPGLLDAAPLRGIIIAKCINSGEQLSAVNPKTGTVTRTRYFPFCIGNQTVPRQEFNSNFTAMAASLPDDNSNDDSHIGVVGPGFTDNLTPPDSSTAYGAQVPNQFNALFNPKTQRVWYQQPNGSGNWGFGSVNPINPINRRTEASDPQGISWNRGDDYYFASDGSGPYGGGIISPDARWEVDGAGDGWKIGLPGKAQNNAEISGYDQPTNLGPINCSPLQFIDGTQFLCNASLPNEAQIYVMTIQSNGQLSQKALLPPAPNEVIEDVIAEPGGQQVAFTTTHGGDYTDHRVLYIVPITGGSPRYVVDLGGEILPPVMLLAWAT